MPAIPIGSELGVDVLAELVVSAGSWALRSSYELAAAAKDADSLFTAAAPELMGRAAAQAIAPLLDVEAISSEVGGERFRLFLTSPDLFNYVQRLFIAELALKQDAGAAMEDELARIWSAWVGIAITRLRPHVRRVFRALRAGIAAAVEEARSCGVEPSELRGHQLVLISRQLSAIELRIASLARKGSLESFQDFERRYRGQVQDRSTRLTPPHIDDARRVPFDDIYVEPMFAARRGRTWGSDRLSLEGLRGVLSRTVVLGQPGGGKSTLTNKLCLDLSRDYNARLVGGLTLTPVPVILRDYGQAKTDRQLSLIQFIEEIAASDYQVKPPGGAFEYIMQQGRALVIFDGLDELVDPTRRRHIRDDIESFCAMYPAVRVIVTAREIGYDQAPLDPREFTTFRLVEFNDEQVGAYVHRWFGAHPDISAQQRQRQASAFLRESAATVDDLRRNPLLLALMCNIYKGEGYIPTNRPDVYEKCSNMLLRRWDSSRGIEFTRPLGPHLERTLQHLAHWIFRNVDLQSGVGERKLLDVATQYLSEKRFDDPDEAREQAQNFLTFCKGRAWVLVEVGSSNKEPLFGFAHRTFLEYFTADYLVRNSESTEALGRFLISQLRKPAWDVVAQLAFQIQNVYKEDAGDELLEMTLQAANHATAKEGAAELSFAVRSLEFLVPTPRVTRQVITTAVDALVAVVTESVKRGPRVDGRRSATREFSTELLMSEISEIADENATRVSAAVRERLEVAIDSENLARAVAGAVVVHILSRVTFGTRPSFLQGIGRDLRDDRSDRFAALGRRDPVVGELLLHQGSMEAREYLELFGPANLLAGAGSYLDLIFLNVNWPDTIFRPLGAASTAEMIARADQELAAVGASLLESALPWLPGRWRTNMRLRGVSLQKDLTAEVELTPDALFGVFCSCAVVAQSNVSVLQHRFFVRLGRVVNSSALVRVTRARTEGPPEMGLEQCLEELGWSERQKAFAQRWARKQISLVGRSKAPA